MNEIEALLRTQIDAMLKHLAALGQPLPDRIPDLASADFGTLAGFHNELAALVDPAMPVTLATPPDANDGGDGAFGRTTVIMFVLVLVGIALFALGTYALTPADLQLTLVELASSWKIFPRLAFVLGAASVGSAAATLFQISHFAVRRAFDPRYEPVYLLKFGLGILTGLLLAEFLTFNSSDGTGFGAATLALLGGFSSTVVYRLIKRLLAALESIFMGETDELVKQAQRLAETRAQEEALRARVRLATEVARLQQRLGGDPGMQPIRAELERMLTDLLGEPAASPPPAVGAVAPAPVGAMHPPP